VTGGVSAALVLTTINDPLLLEGYYNNFAQYDRLSQVIVFVIPDEKTPAAAWKRCDQLRRRGLRVHCPTMREQEDFLSRLGSFARLIPHNSENRRNIGFLMALEAGVDFLISIDDDNFCRLHEDFFGEHSVVTGLESLYEVVHSSDRWFNVCELLRLQPSLDIYPRGFPYRYRHKERTYVYAAERATVRMNLGLWVEQPDLDAMTWLVAPVHSEGLSRPPLVLARDTWTPVNTQNTAVHRELIPAYYCVRMGYPLGGIPIDRYGDIFSGYFCQAVARHLGYSVRVGTPVAEHRRNVHNYLRDAYHELIGLWVLEDVAEWLTESKLEGKTCEDAYLSLSYALQDAVEGFSGYIWTDATRGYFHQMAHFMRQWLKACNVIKGNTTRR